MSPESEALVLRYNQELILVRHGGGTAGESTGREFFCSLHTLERWGCTLA